MYMLPFRCRVTGQTGDAAIGSAMPPVWCEDDKTQCVQGPKQVKNIVDSISRYCLSYYLNSYR